MKLHPLLLCLPVLVLSAHAHEARPHAPASTPVLEQKPWGIAATANVATRTVRIAMQDNMRFTPDQVTVRQGEVIRFVLSNQGQMLHEFVIGDEAELRSHAAQMLKHPGMQHDEPYMAHVPRGHRQDLVWRFNRTGDFGFACLIAGHFQAGMVGTIRVLATDSVSPSPSKKEQP